MPGFYTIYEDAKGERRFCQGDRRELLPDLRRLGIGFITSFPVKYPGEMTDGALIYDAFPVFNREEWPTFPENNAFDWGLSLSQIDSSIGGKTDIVVRNKGVKIFQRPQLKKSTGATFCCYCGILIGAPFAVTKEHLIPVSKN